MKKYFLLFLFAGMSFGLNAVAEEGRWFGDLYSEGILLGRSQDIAGFGQLRGGQRLGNFEFYAVARGSTDTKSDANPLGQIYNDNFLFLGAGADYLLPVIPGVRLRVQIGDTLTLGGSNHRESGFDYLAGAVSYHELAFGEFGFENYGEALYIYRYRDLLMSDQLRFLYKRFDTQAGSYTLGIYPYLSGSIAYDTAAVEYNRFLDARAGLRFSAHSSNVSFSLSPYYVVGQYFAGAQVGGSNTFDEFRVLATVYVSF